MCWPRAFVRSRGSAVRIRSRSNSASSPSTVSIKRPCGVVVSAQVSPREWKPALRSVIAARVFRRSRVERCDRHHVAGVELVDQPAQLRAVGLGSADIHVREHLLAAGLGQLPCLRVNVLALGTRRYPWRSRISRISLVTDLRNGKPSLFRLLILLRNSCRPCENSS
jgi:hypothetical protein